jgi:hypothetical protein
MDHLNLDNRETYQSEQRLLFRMPTKKLKRIVKELYEMRFEDQEECVDGYYRLAVSVLLKRNKKSIGDIICFIEITFVLLLYKSFINN